MNYGLGHYGAFEVTNSGWLAAVVDGNTIHPRYSSVKYDRFRHFIVAFHDDTFECLAEGYSWSVDLDGAV